MLRDGRQVEHGALLEYDIAVVGAGMAGLTLVDRLRGSGLRVCLIEGGGLDPEIRLQRLNKGRNIGHPYIGLDRSRFRVLGGSSTRWGGWCRPLDPIDFEERDWIPLSGWPLRHGDLVPYYRQAARVVDLQNASFDPSDWQQVMPAVPSTGSPDLEPIIVQHSAEIDFGERSRMWLTRSREVTVLLHTNVTDLRLHPEGQHLERVEVATLTGKRFSVAARSFVLAAGGIENARLLLASRQQRQTGLGNESDFVGRCFMEHLHLSPGTIDLRDGVTLPEFFTRQELGATAWVHGSLAPTAHAARRRQLPTCFFTLDQMPRIAGPAALLDLPQPVITPIAVAYRRLRRRRPEAGARLRSAVAATWRTGRHALHLRETRRGNGKRTRRQISVYARCEQTPNPASRITLDTARDQLGMPRVCLDWRIASRDLRAVREWTAALDRSLRTSGLGHLTAKDWEDRVVGGPHHMGTTRMSLHRREGVVDASCRVHTVSNLFVAGSSVFTTGGHANPSLTVLALSLRLGDHLRRLHGVSPEVSGAVAPAGALPAY